MTPPSRGSVLPCGPKRHPPTAGRLLPSAECWSLCRIQRYADPVAALICRHLRIDLGVLPQTRVGPPHHLEIHPPQADLSQGGPDMATEQIVAPKRRFSVLRGEHPSVRGWIDRGVP